LGKVVESIKPATKRIFKIIRSPAIEMMGMYFE